MPLKNVNGKWYWGKSGPYSTKAKALSVARAAYAHGYKEDANKPIQQEMLRVGMQEPKKQAQ